ncbi:MAG: hypothetical protein NC931_07610 [Candidatus Omnitrophica bacterium]|nr:hypothetical protein [Candidatus Omnitrophota bacterium]
MKRKYFGLVIVGLVALALATSGCSKKKQAEEQASVSKPEGAADRHVGNL